MIKDFEQFVNENLTSLVGRYRNNAGLRKEEGVHFKSCIGEMVTLHNREEDEVIKDILNQEGIFEVLFEKLSEMNYTPEEKENVMNFKGPYDYLIYESTYSSNLIVEFTSYEEVLNFQLDDTFENMVCEEDYIEMCRAIATKLKEFGEFIVCSDRTTMHELWSDTTIDESFYLFELINESDVYAWLDNHEDKEKTYLQDFIKDFCKEFPEADKPLTDVKLYGWTFYPSKGECIGLKINYDTLINIERYKEFTQNWFRS